MSLTAEQIFDAIAPDYKDDTDKAVYLEMAENRTSTCAYGAKRAEAVAYHAAHLIEMSKGSDYSGSGGGGPITSKREGKLGVGFGSAGMANSQGDADLSRTKYGSMLLSLAKGNIIKAGVTGGCTSGCY